MSAKIIAEPDLEQKDYSSIIVCTPVGGKRCEEWKDAEWQQIKMLNSSQHTLFWCIRSSGLGNILAKLKLPMTQTISNNLYIFDFYVIIFFVALVRLTLQGRYENVMTVVCGAARANAVTGKDVESAP